MQDRNGGREMLVTELDLHWENEKKKKKTGETELLFRALLFEYLELTNIRIAITCNGGGQKVK